MIAGALSPWPPLPVSAWLHKPVQRLPFPLEEPRTRRFALGRTALWHGVRALGLCPGDEVLAPAYHHGSEIQALVAAGLVPRFYSTQPGLVPDADELETMLGERTRALLLIHVLGLVQPTVMWRRWCDERGLVLIDDVAQGWLSESDGAPAGYHADLALFCLYKTFGIPDGAALFLRSGRATEADGVSSGLRGTAKGNAAWVAQRWAPAGGGWTWLRSRRRRRFDPDAEIALGDTSAAMSSIARMLLPRLAANPAAATRRAYYRLLLERLGDMLPEEMPSLPEGAAPFAFPVWARDKPLLLANLARDGIDALDFWSTPHPALVPGRDSVGERLRRHVVGLPVHQELTPGDLDRIATAVVGSRHH